MFCSNCGNKLLDTAKFCGSCGKNVSSTAVIEQEKFSNEKENVREEDGTISNTDNSKAVIKCGNCDFVGQGEPARRMVFKILAWSVVWFAPLLTLLYFVATYKYRCPKCHSTFLGIKNKQGIFVGQRGGSSRWAIIVVIILVGIAVMGILASIVLASLNSARMKSRDARRIADIKRIQLTLELYYDVFSEYPASLAALTPKFLPEAPTDPSNQTVYSYIFCPKENKYHLGSSLEESGHSSLAMDSDQTFLCSSDTINGLDSSKCSETDFGGHCYDVTND